MIDQLIFLLALAILRLWRALWPYFKGQTLATRIVIAAARKGWLVRQWRPVNDCWYWIDLADPICRTLVLEGAVKTEIRGHIMDWLPESGTFVDIGAGIGYLTIEAAWRAGRRGRILAIEQNSGAASMLRENLHRNRLLNVTVASEVTRQVLDKLDLKRVDVVRIASQGSTLQTLRDLEDLVSAFHPTVIVESTPASVVFYLENLGYTSQWIGDGGTVFRRHSLPAKLQAVPERQDAWEVPA